MCVPVCACACTETPRSWVNTGEKVVPTDGAARARTLQGVSICRLPGCSPLPLAQTQPQASQAEPDKETCVCFVRGLTSLPPAAIAASLSSSPICPYPSFICQDPNICLSSKQTCLPIGPPVSRSLHPRQFHLTPPELSLCPMFRGLVPLHLSPSPGSHQDSK